MRDEIDEALAEAEKKLLEVRHCKDCRHLHRLAEDEHAPEPEREIRSMRCTHPIVVNKMAQPGYHITASENFLPLCAQARTPEFKVRAFSPLFMFSSEEPKEQTIPEGPCGPSAKLFEAAEIKPAEAPPDDRSLLRKLIDYWRS